MKKSFYYIWILLITIQEFLQYGQTQSINDDELDLLTMDQAYLTISNKNYSNSITLMYNLIVCEKCNFENLGDIVLYNSSQTIIINTTYAYDFQIFIESTNKTLQCSIK